MQDDTSIFEPEESKAITWKDFKEKRKDWTFGEVDPDNRDFEGKAQLAWKKVGRRFCKRFGTEFTEYGEQSALTPRSRHYLLILDASSSMCDEGKWDAVEEAVKKMAQQESGLALDSRFSVIPFSSSARVAISNSTASELLGSRLAPAFEGTNFTAAFQCAAEFVNENDFSGRRPMVIFMTDGEDLMKPDHRKAAIRDLICEFDDKQLDGGWDFTAIAFGSFPCFDSLKEIHEQVRRATKSSQYIEASKSMDLVQVLLQAWALHLQGRSCWMLFFSVTVKS